MMRVLMEDIKGELNKTNNNITSLNEKLDQNSEETNKNIESLKGDNQKLSQQMAENSKTMEEKMDELRQDSQKNMEVLNQKMAENNEKVNKKIEEEMTSIRQEISEIHGKWEITSHDLQQTKEDFGERMTNMEEDNQIRIESIKNRNRPKYNTGTDRIWREMPGDRHRRKRSSRTRSTKQKQN